MLRAVADTHAIIWHVFADNRPSPRARTFIESTAAAGDQIAISAVTLVEIAYLVKKGRLPAGTLAEVLSELARVDTVLVDVPVDRSVATNILQVARIDVPDMPDRIIAATAVGLGLPLISRDGKIRTSGVSTIW